jgi:hypothetical protein
MTLVRRLRFFSSDLVVVFREVPGVPVSGRGGGAGVVVFNRFAEEEETVGVSELILVYL